MRRYHLPSGVLLSLCGSALLALCGSLVACGPGTSDPATDDRPPGGPLVRAVPAAMYTWYSPSRHDFHTTSDREWYGAPGASHAPDYVFVRTEGSVWRADLEQPLDTIALHSWYNPTRRDHRLVAGTDLDADLTLNGYRHLRTEGFAPTQPLAGTVRLLAKHNPSTGDHAVTTAPFFDRPGYRAQGPVAYLLPDFDRGTADEELVRFGYRSMEATGWRPLIVVLRHQTDSPVATPRAASFYDNLVFGPGLSIRNVFSDNSKGLFTFARTRVVETTLGRGVDLGTDNPLLHASTAGFRFASYDANHDGRVTSDELSALVIDDTGSSCGQTHSIGCFRPPGETVNVCLSGSFVGNTVGIATAAHELAHQLGAVDLYGPRAAWNRNATLMAGTCGAADSPTIFHLDPWHKMAFGWIRPRLLSTADPASAFTIWQPLGGDLPGDAPVLLFDPARGSNEYYLAETRLRDGRNIFDANVADDGVALWHVATTDDHVPRDIFFQDDDDPELDHRLTVALAHAPDGGVNRRFPDFWSSVNGRFTLSWPDGTATGSSLLVAARPAHQRYTEVELGNDMLPRVDEPLAAAWASPGGEFTMRGVFGVMGSRVVALEQDGRFIDLPVVSWSNERVVTRVPAGTLLGSYRLAVYAGPTHAARGNRVTVFVSDPGSEEVR